MVSDLFKSLTKGKIDQLTYQLLLDEAKVVMAEKDEAIAALEAELNSTKNNPDLSEFEQLKSSYTVLLTDKQSQEAEIESLLQEKNSLVKDNQILEQANQTLCEEKDALVSANNNSLDLIENLNHSLASKESSLEKLNEQLQNSQLTEQGLIEELKKIQSSYTDLLSEKQSQEAELESLLQEKNSLVKDKQRLVQDNKGLSSDNKRLINEKASLLETIRITEIDNERLTDSLKVQKQECNVLKVKLLALQSTQQQLEAMQKQFEYFFEQNRQQLAQATNALGTHVTDVSKHIVSDVKTFVNFQQVFGISHQSVDSLNEKIPPELLLYLHNLLHKKSFDLIIVFGSEALTTFLAKELAASANQKHQQRQHRLETDTVTIENSNLPKRILSFEDKKDKVKALKHSLLDKQLSGWVNVRFAPLVACHLGSKDYVFYDISKPLGRIADTFEDVQANILVVQPSDLLPSELSKDAILPLILQELGTHQIELLALSDNTVRSKQIEQWIETLNRREAEYELVENHPSLPNSIVLKLNP